MKKFYIVVTFVFAALFSCFICFGCSKDKESDTCTIYGTVFERNGDPVRAAEVEVSQYGNVIATTVTGNDGTYELSLTPNFQYNIALRVSAKGYSSVTKEVKVYSGQKTPIDIVLY